MRSKAAHASAGPGRCPTSGQAGGRMTARPAITKIDASNSLTDLAARIVAAHQAVSTALKDSVQHAITAGELLIEAKDKVGGHGNWLPWLRDHCTISERTAQL